jgi:hypothetical protein
VAADKLSELCVFLLREFVPQDLRGWSGGDLFGRHRATLRRLFAMKRQTDDGQIALLDEMGRKPEHYGGFMDWEQLSHDFGKDIHANGRNMRSSIGTVSFALRRYESQYLCS